VEFGWIFSSFFRVISAASVCTVYKEGGREGGEFVTGRSSCGGGMAATKSDLTSNENLGRVLT
jgi:hypothetical protein